jgi:cell division protein FtsL
MTAILDFIISLSFMFLLVSLIVSALTELISQWLDLRGRMLYYSIGKLLDNKDEYNWGEMFYKHPSIKQIRQDKLPIKLGIFGNFKKRYPSYIAPGRFSEVLIDNIRFWDNVKSINQPLAAMDDLEIKELIQSLPEGDMKRSLVSTLSLSALKTTSTLTSIEQWYTDYMDRVSGWYTRKIGFISLLVAFAVSIIFNINTIHVTRELWINKELRTLSADMAIGSYQQFNPDQFKSTHSNARSVTDSVKALEIQAKINELKLLRGEIDSLTTMGYPIGWSKSIFEKVKSNASSEEISTFNMYCSKALILLICILGWMTTAVMAYMGAPFWYDVLNKVVPLRKTGAVPKS